MNKTNKIITIVTMLLLIASLIGNFYLMNNQEIVKHVQIQNAQEEYAQKYMDFDSQTKQVKKSIYEGSLAAGTSPTEVKYLLMKLAPELNDAEKYELIRELLSPGLNNMFVTPKNIDEIIVQMSYTLSEALNQMCHVMG